MTIGEEDDLTQLVVVGLDGEAVGHAHVLTAHIVDRRTMSQLQDGGADRQKMLVQLAFQLSGHVMLAGPFENLLVFALVRLGDRAEGELLDLIGLSKGDHLLDFGNTVDEALDHDHSEPHREAEAMQFGNKGRQVHVVLFAGHVDLFVFVSIVVADRDGHGGQTGVVPVLEVLVGDLIARTVGDEQAVGLQLDDREVEGREILQEFADLVGEDGRLTFGGDHRRAAAAVASELASLLEVAPVDVRSLAADAVFGRHVGDAKGAARLACHRASDDAKSSYFHSGFLWLTNNRRARGAWHL